MSNYDNPELRYSCFSEPIPVSRNHSHSLTLRSKRGNLQVCASRPVFPPFTLKEVLLCELNKKLASKSRLTVL